MSDLSNGEKLLSILSLYDLVIEKVGEHEPIRKEFTKSEFFSIWKGRGGVRSSYKSAYFLFKGKKEISFSGMASWSLNIHPNSKSFNSISLWLNVPKKYDVSKIIRLADELFIWSEAVYGRITEDTKNVTNLRIQKQGYLVSLGNVYDGLSGLMWVNYFGIPYLLEKDFHLPKDHTKVGHGARFILTETPDDESLSDLNFLNTYIKQIGSKWFYPFDRIEGNKCFLPENFKEQDIKTPSFDNSAITRRDD